MTARINDLLERKLSEAEHTPGCVCVLDLDNFKYINDRFGHQAGDKILRDFSARVQQQVRRADCFGRIGGEEFVLVLPRTTVQEAEFIVERMLATIRMSRPLNDRPDFQYTFSAGIAEAQPGRYRRRSLCTRRQRALFRQAGRQGTGSSSTPLEVAWLPADDR